MHAAFGRFLRKRGEENKGGRGGKRGGGEGKGGGGGRKEDRGGAGDRNMVLWR